MTFEEEELATRAEYREKTGKGNPRPRHSKVQKADARQQLEFPVYQGVGYHAGREREWLGDTIEEFVNTTEAAPLPEVPPFPESRITVTATESFEAWKSQVQMPDLILASDVDSDDSLEEFVAQAMPRTGKASL